MNIGLYFGTYNPIHVGHLIIGNYMANYTDLDEVWFVVSPQNPLKIRHTLLEDYHRLAMVRVAIENNTKLKASDIEFTMPKPSYTSDTLIYLHEKYPKYNFSLIMGEDNLRTLHKWKNYQEIIANYAIYVYPRALTEQERNDEEITKNETNDILKHANIKVCDAPVMKLSSSFIRSAIADKKDIQYLLTEPVYKYLTEMNFYKKKEL